VLQPSRPAEIAEIVGAAFGLTRRERDVVLLVASGHTNAEISRLLGVSKYTVADHLKRVFDKVDVASRGELTSKLFQDYYLPRAFAGRPAGADGWFLPD
jgi:DNA-binding CsgD family transcriptional regulator